MILSFVGAISTIVLVLIALVFMISTEVRQYHCRREMRMFEQFAHSSQQSAQPRGGPPQ